MRREVHWATLRSAPALTHSIGQLMSFVLTRVDETPIDLSRKTRPESRTSLGNSTRTLQSNPADSKNRRGDRIARLSAVAGA